MDCSVGIIINSIMKDIINKILYTRFHVGYFVCALIFAMGLCIVALVELI